MNQIQVEIENAYRILSSATVSGDLVDVVAAARMSLRRAYQLAKDKEKSAVAAQAQENGEKGERTE